jgi:hypothetical protein
MPAEHDRHEVVSWKQYGDRGPAPCQRQIESLSFERHEMARGNGVFQPSPRTTKSGDAARLLALSRSAGGRLQRHDHRPAAEAILRAVEFDRARRRPGVAELPG